MGESPARSKCRTERRLCEADVTSTKRASVPRNSRTAYASCAVSVSVSSTTMRGIHPECLRGLCVTLRHGRRATRRLDPEDPIPVTIPNPRRFAPIAGWPASPERVAGFTWNPRPATRGMGGQLHEANPNALAALHDCPECLLKAVPSGVGKEAPVAY